MMETLSKKLSSQDSDGSTKNDREISPTRKSSKSEHKRKTSMATSRDNEKPKRK